MTTRVLLVHSGRIPHYRISIYGYLSRYLSRYGFALTVASNEIQSDDAEPVEFEFAKTPLSAFKIAQLVYRRRIDVVVMFVDMRHLYLFPTYFVAKGLLGRRMVYWGQGGDLADQNARLKNMAYVTEQAMCDSIILYAEHLKKYVHRRFHKKVFVANNTLRMEYAGLAAGARNEVLARYGIRTKKNIICVGRIQRRKRLDILIGALEYMNRSDVGLILVGPDPEGILSNVDRDNIYKLGPLYGAQKFDLLSAADVYCLPGAVGLSIVDAFHCGLPFVTEEGDESAEIMYLRNGENGFIVPRGDIKEIAQKLSLLLDDDALRGRFSLEARKEMEGAGHIDRLCEGFRDALRFAVGQTV